MSNFEFVYLCFATGAFVFFGVALAGAVAYSKGKPSEQTVHMPAGNRAHA